MANRLLRRSGIAVALIAELIEWEPTVIFQVGVGTHFKEVEVFREAWPNAKLIGWEPHPEIAEKIAKDYPGTLHRHALGDDWEKRTLYYDPAHMEAASFFPGESELQVVGVMVKRLDYYCIFPPVTSDDKRLLWLDCEGAELEVLKGGVEFIKGVDVINVELTGKPSRIGWPSPVEVNRWLLDHGFVSQYIHTHRCTSGQNDMVYVRPELFHSEYCSCPLQVEEWERRKDG